MTDKLESLWIEIDTLNDRNILCGIFYRHPNYHLDPFLDTFYATIDKFNWESKHILFMGDFNIMNHIHLLRTSLIPWDHISFSPIFFSLLE